jgi:hypothetical protein
MAPLYLFRPLFWRRLDFTATLLIAQAECKDESGQIIDSTQVMKEAELPAPSASLPAFAPPRGYLVHAPLSVAEKRAGTSWIFLP